MSRPGIVSCSVAALLVVATAAPAHITPPVVLVADRDALLGLLAGATRFFVREVRLSPEEREALRQHTGWTPEEDFHRFYIGRDDAGRLVAAAIFVTEFTIHGPVRVAVASGAGGRVRGARIVEVTEETYPWVKPLVDHDFARDYVGRDSRAPFALSERLAEVVGGEMSRFYGQLVADLVRRGAALCEHAVLARGPGAHGTGPDPVEGPLARTPSPDDRRRPEPGPRPYQASQRTSSASGSRRRATARGGAERAGST